MASLAELAQRFSAGSSWSALPVSTPGLVLDLDILDRNLAEMVGIARSAGVELWPHAKTHRIAELGRYQIERGATGLCVAKLGEAEAFAAAGITRLFVANPVVGDDKAARAVALHRRIDLTLATDTVEAAAGIGRIFAEAGERVKMMLAVDSGLGREGVRPQAAPEVGAAIHGLPGVELVGIYTHEGTTYGATDEADLARRSVTAGEAMVAAAESIRARGVPLPIVSVGASASAREIAHVPGITHIRPGIFAFNDVGQIALGNASLSTTAVRVVATVTSHPDPERACIDAGSKSLSGDLVPASAHRDEFPGYGMLVNAPGWVLERLSEEHGWLRWRGTGAPSPLPVGTRLEIVPNHVCMAFVMLRRASVVRGGRLVVVWDGFGPGASE
jgi:D-serine deaminase-like pyridoxal phosphate-dependent protein